MRRHLGFALMICAFVFLAKCSWTHYFETNSTRELTMDESYAVWGAGGDCTDSANDTTFGCSDPGCQQIKNDKFMGMGGDKETSHSCSYLSGGQDMPCGTVKLAGNCNM